MNRTAGEQRAGAVPRVADRRHEATTLPTDFDTVAWTRAVCEASGVPFAIEDPVVLAKLRDLVEHPA
jgi:hypothetical protein